MNYGKRSVFLESGGREQSVREAARILDVLQKLKDKRSRTAGPERDAELFFLERKIREYRDDLNRARSI